MTSGPLSVVRRAAALLALTAVLVVGCSSGKDDEKSADKDGSGGNPTVATVASTLPTTDPPLPTAPATVTTPPPRQPATSQRGILDENRRLWKEQSPDSYTLSYTKECDCDAAQRGEFTVTVTDGEITASQGPSDVSGEAGPSFDTVESLFSVVDGALDRNEKIEVTYDPTYGLPSSIALDRSSGSVKDVVSYTVVQFTPT